MKTRLNRSAFTLIEMLVIIIILGVLVTIVRPVISTGGDMSRVSAAARGVMQMSRYARTMAILHQNAMELTFSGSGKLSVTLEGNGGRGESIVSAKSFAVTNSVTAAEEARLAEFATEHDNTSGGGSGAYTMADVNVDKSYAQVRFVFLGYTDTADAGRYSHLLTPSASTSAVDDKEEGDEDSVRVVRVRYKSNGTVRPYRVQVKGEGDNAFSLTVAVDMLGSAKVEEHEENRR